jgi:hypothetical protein
VFLELDDRFHAFKQEDISVSNYCCRMKDMIVELRALGETVIDRYIVLNLLHVLNKRRGSIPFLRLDRQLILNLLQ